MSLLAVSVELLTHDFESIPEASLKNANKGEIKYL